jgi:tRNA(Ile)-lysidine synthase
MVSSNSNKEKSLPEEIEVCMEKLTSAKGKVMEYKFLEGTFKFQVYELKHGLRHIPNLMYTKYFDYDRIKNNLHIRFRRPGDMIQIDIKGSKKKIKDYFIDEKIPKDERGFIPLLASENNILWVVGHRIGEQFRITKDTKMVLEVSYEHYN